MDDETEETTTESPVVLQAFTCERCGFEYHKAKDYKPYLCYRCLKFLAKGVFRIYNQLQPATSRTISPE